MRFCICCLISFSVFVQIKSTVYFCLIDRRLAHSFWAVIIQVSLVSRRSSTPSCQSLTPAQCSLGTNVVKLSTNPTSLVGTVTFWTMRAGGSWIQGYPFPSALKRILPTSTKIKSKNQREPTLYTLAACWNHRREARRMHRASKNDDWRLDFTVLAENQNRSKPRFFPQNRTETYSLRPLWNRNDTNHKH